jgi:hypothetical protein
MPRAKLVRLEIAADREELRHRVGDGGARGQHVAAARPALLEVARLHVEVHRAHRALGVDALDVAALGGEVELAEQVRLVDVDEVDAQLLEREGLVAAPVVTARMRCSACSICCSTLRRVMFLVCWSSSLAFTSLRMREARSAGPAGIAARTPGSSGSGRTPSA